VDILRLQVTTLKQATTGLDTVTTYTAQRYVTKSSNTSIIFIIITLYIGPFCILSFSIIHPASITYFCHKCLITTFE